MSCTLAAEALSLTIYEQPWALPGVPTSLIQLIIIIIKTINLVYVAHLDTNGILTAPYIVLQYT